VGGRGAMLQQKASERIPEYKTAGYIAGIKVLKALKENKDGSLPDMSNTPGTRYILLDKNDNFKRMRIYDNNRHPVIDIDYGHSHKGSDKLHIHFWKGGRDNNGRSLTRKEKKKYGKILREAEVNV
jgi:hypothetical protein